MTVVDAVVLFALPGLYAIAAWAVGRVVLAGCRDGEASDGMAVLVGLAAGLAVLSNLSFLAGLGMGAAVPVLLVLALVTAVLGRRHLRPADGRESVLLALAALVTYAHFLVPLLLDGGAEIALVDAGDFHQYVGMAGWLQHHGIGDSLVLGAGFSPLEGSAAYHQTAKLRIGALLLLGFVASSADSDVPRVYSLYSGFILALLALAVALFARRIAPGLPKWVAALAGLLFGISPTATWASYASFVPQTLGLAFLVAGVALVMQRVDAAASPAPSWRVGVLRGVPAGLLWFAAWSCYPEAFPLGALLCVLYLLLALGRRWAEPELQRGVLQLVVGVLGACVIASPANFWWGMEGMVLQLAGTPHGGAQEVNAWSLFGTAIGAMQQPLGPEAGRYSGDSSGIASLFACALAVAGWLWLLLHRGRAVALAVLLSGGLLFWFVVQRYSFARLGTLPDWQALFTWNLFKAAGFTAPFVSACAVVGTVALGQGLARRGGAWVGAALIALALVPVALRQDVLAAKRFTYVRIPGELRGLLAGIPAGRLLVDIHTEERERDHYQRHAMYAALWSRPFVSTVDWQPGHLSDVGDPDMRPVRADFLREPFAYVLTDAPERYPAARIVGTSAPYTLLDVRATDFVLTLDGWTPPPVTLVNIAHAAEDRKVAVTLLSPTTGRVLDDAPWNDQVREANIADGPVLMLRPGARGGLADLFFDPAPADPVLLTLRTEAPDPPPRLIDLKPQISAAVISSDPNGRRMAAEQANGVLRLTMPEPGTSRAQVSAQLEPGDYVLRVETGGVTVHDRDRKGFGAFLGPENDVLRSIELTAHSQQSLALKIAQRQQLSFAIGFGGWGSAGGSMEIRKLELVRQGVRP